VRRTPSSQAVELAAELGTALMTMLGLTSRAAARVAGRRYGVRMFPVLLRLPALRPIAWLEGSRRRATRRPQR
jgi:hypothetical protein